MKKSKVIQTLEDFPEEFNTEELIEKLLFIEKVEKGLKDISEGKTIPMEEVKRRFESKWAKEQ
jgi:predicted transcriptional regulator